MRVIYHACAFLGLLSTARCVNFPWESIQLRDEDVGGFSAIAFGDTSAPGTVSNSSACRAYPGSPDWPVDDDWARLNSSLDGALLKPTPPGAVCYPGPNYNFARCVSLLFTGGTSRFFIDDPLTVLTSWPTGDTCSLSLRPTGNCTQGGFPVYVVKAATVRHIQTAVNFARNKNLRLVIKNTGHDFNGRSTGAGALSIWTHWLKSFEFLPEYTVGEYSGPAARVGSGLEAWELYQYMDIHNMTIVVPGGSTVGAYGGWAAGGGHSTLASIYGLGSDQFLSLDVVTADGRVVTADPTQNQDLFYALRGGGPGTYGIVTSAIVKAYPPIQVTQSVLAFSVGNAGGFGINDTKTFWKGVNEYQYYGKAICEAGGTAYSYISSLGSGSFSFSTTVEMPGKTPSEVISLMQPLIDKLNTIGIPVNNSQPSSSLSWGSNRQGEGDSPGNTRFATRLLPARNWDNATLFQETMDAIQATIEAGYTFHGIHLMPTEKTAGYPGNSSVNPAFRRTLMHADVFDMVGMQGAGTNAQTLETAHARLNGYMDLIRAATPDGGAYINEADVQEPDWQRSFFGDRYEGLLGVKKERDPWGLFWAPTTVGSEGWEVRTADGLPTQDGMLCRVGAGA
ncbi:FAD-binding domain-containing protein [Coniochaeta ligniaria NRRL 30616]|uniref:FAD-binding domain-containing protein n=1 Tax=Coniochaeta ligniaria NRRL 30616 TaxID=1408157 RepID=A0A1J7ID76_9PEZI|nr:FAD-binding domain-containing protein [Coniochaeta ligniaria NRRL 30616]